MTYDRRLAGNRWQITLSRLDRMHPCKHICLALDWLVD